MSSFQNGLRPKEAASGAAFPAGAEADFGPPIRQGGLELRPVASRPELAALLALRARAFRGDGEADDGDAFDTHCIHLQVSRIATGDAAGDSGAPPLAGLRALRLETPFAGYAGQFYAPPEARSEARPAPPTGPALELGRLCLDPAAPGPDALRLIWAGVARLVARTGAARLIGCTSFRSTDPAAFAPALGLLAQRHIGPDAARPRRFAPETRDLAEFADAARPEAAALLPPLLRGYLALGGWVSDHLVIDRALGTFHVFTCVEIATMPEARKRILRGLAGEN